MKAMNKWPCSLCCLKLVMSTSSGPYQSSVELIKRSAVRTKYALNPRIYTYYNEKPAHLDFTDVIVLMAEGAEGLHIFTDPLNLMARIMGLRISSKKMK